MAQDAEAYLTAATRQQRVDEWLELIHPNGRSRGHEFEMNSSVLLVLDMQKYFLEAASHAYVPSSGSVKQSIQLLINAYRTAHRPVIYTRHIDVLGSDSSMKSWWRHQILPDDPRSALEFQPAEGELAIDKTEYDAFNGTYLTEMCELLKARHIVVVGLVAHLCVETTIRSAFCQGFQVWLPMDATASWRAVNHEASLLNLSHGCARMTYVDELLDWVR